MTDRLEELIAEAIGLDVVAIEVGAVAQRIRQALRDEPESLGLRTVGSVRVSKGQYFPAKNVRYAGPVYALPQEEGTTP